MNDLQAQLEEANKEKQELQEKVGTRISLGRERVPGSLFVGTSSQVHMCFFLPSVSISECKGLGLEPCHHSRCFWLQPPHFAFLFPLWSLVLSFLSKGQNLCQRGVRWGLPLSQGPILPALCASLPPPASGHHGDPADREGGTEPAPSLPRLSSFFLSCPRPPATSPPEPSGVPGAVHGGQVPGEQAGS